MSGPGGARPGAGRPKGAKNKKKKEDFTAALEAAGFAPEAAAVAVAMDRAPCMRCDDGQVPALTAAMYQGVTDAKQLANAARRKPVPCRLCMGSGFRVLGDGEQWKALARIIDSRVPKLSAVQITGEEGGAPVLVVLHHEADEAKRAVTEKLLAYAQAAAESAGEAADDDE